MALAPQRRPLHGTDVHLHAAGAVSEGNGDSGQASDARRAYAWRVRPTARQRRHPLLPNATIDRADLLSDHRTHRWARQDIDTADPSLPSRAPGRTSTIPALGGDRMQRVPDARIAGPERRRHIGGMGERYNADEHTSVAARRPADRRNRVRDHRLRIRHIDNRQPLASHRIIQPDETPGIARHSPAALVGAWVRANPGRTSTTRHPSPTRRALPRADQTPAAAS